jgi:hypothetical protein
MGQQPELEHPLSDFDQLVDEFLNEEFEESPVARAGSV